MDQDSTSSTALVRGLYAAIVTALVAGVTAYVAFNSLIDDAAQAVGDITDNEIVGYAVLTGVLAGLAAFLVRGLVEGRYDAGRAARREIKPGDVGYLPSHPTV